MLNLGLSLLCVVGYYKIYTEFVTWKICPKSSFILFKLVHLPLYFIEFIIVWCHIYSLWLITVIYNYCWCITSFESSLVKKETCMFYVANFITCSVFPELLWKANLLVCYNMNIFQPPLIEWVGYSCTVTRRLHQVYNVR